jgi:hypothetical protein
MATYVLRLWLPDRPGALGAVASRVGAVGGDVVGIDILERGAGRAIDEIVVELADHDWIGLLLTEVAEVDGVDVEQVTPVADSMRDPRLDALETAAVLVGAHTSEEAIGELCQHAIRQLGASWGAVVSTGEEVLVTSCGRDVPPVSWLLAFLQGSQSSARVASGDAGPDDVVWAPLPQAALALVLGREGMPFRARERRQASALARIVDTRFRDLRRREAKALHPSLGTALD